MQCDEEVVLNVMLFDEFDFEMLFDSDDLLYYYCFGISCDVVCKLRSGVWIVQVQIDLYGMWCDEVCDVFVEFICEVGKKGLCCLCVIYGKGFGLIGKEFVLKGKVCVWFVQKEEVIVFCEVCGYDGGVGVVFVLLQLYVVLVDWGLCVVFQVDVCDCGIGGDCYVGFCDFGVY